MKFYTFYVSSIFLVKIIYFIFILLVIYFTHKKNNKLIEIFTYWKSQIEFLYTVLMSILLIILFNPYVTEIKLIDEETRILFFMYGLIMLINSHWELFLKN